MKQSCLHSATLTQYKTYCLAGTMSPEKKQKGYKVWDNGPVVERLPSNQQVLASIPGTSSSVHSVICTHIIPILGS